ncbi:hypothetical protein Tco_1233526 [Tanacetum coccineum]
MVYCYEIEDGHSHEELNETRVENNDRLLLEEGDGVLDSEGGQEVMLVKVDDKIYIPKTVLFQDRHFNDTAVNQGLGGSYNDLMSPCSREFDMDNGEVACDGMSIDKADGKNDIPNGFVPDFTCNYIVVNQGLGGLSNDPMVRINLYYIKKF